MRATGARLLPLLLPLVTACGSVEDADGDDVLAYLDCNDEDAAVGAPATWYRDADRDGYGRDDASVEACALPQGHVAVSGDCNDENPEVHPAATERCDEVDNDCSGLVDDDPADAPTWYFDQDHDGYGVSGISEVACEPPKDYTSREGDCDDLDAGSHPGAIEQCDEADNDCDGEIDEPGSSGQTTWYADYDGDGYGNLAYEVEGCEAPDGYVDNAEDCDDSSADASPDNDEEICDDGLDNDCDGDPGDCDLDKDAELTKAEFKLTGDSSSDQFGWSVAGAGDLNRDGYGDFVVAAPYDDTGVSNGGTTYIYYGPLVRNKLGGVSPGAQLVGENSSDNSGYAVAGAGDYDADGFDDLIIGAPGSDLGGSSSGTVYLVRGPVSSITNLDRAHAHFTGTSGYQAGMAVDGAGDLNGDGFADLVVGAPEASADAGRAWLISGGSESGPLEEATATFTPEGDIDRAGQSVAVVGDTDGDGFDDLLIGAPNMSEGNDYAGAAYLFRGPVTGTYNLGDADAWRVGTGPDEYAAQTVAGIGDFNEDGYADVAVAAPLGNSENGVIYLLFGPVPYLEDNLNTADVKVNGTGAANCGNSVAGGGDVNGDGSPDLIIGGTAHADDRGAIFTVPGPVALGSVNLGDHSRYGGDEPSDFAGRSADFVGDVNGDGFDEILVGAYGDDEAASSAGAAYLINGGGF